MGTGPFVASEFSLVNLDRNELEARAQRSESGPRPAISAFKITSTRLSSAQLDITYTTLLTGLTFEPALSRMLAGPLTAAGVLELVVPVIGTVAGVAIATSLSMVIGELVPKNFAPALPLDTAGVWCRSRPHSPTIFDPLILLFTSITDEGAESLDVQKREKVSLSLALVPRTFFSLSVARLRARFGR